MPQSSRGRARLLLFALQLAACVAFASPISRLVGDAAGFPLDDAWIHQVVARTFAATGTIGYYAGAHGTGATSYLWAVLLGAGRLLHLGPVLWTAMLGVASVLVTGQGLLDLAWPDDERDVPSVVVAVFLAALGGELTWYAFSGMEASLVCAQLVAALAQARSRFLPPRRRALVAGAIAGAAALTRPDLVPFGLVVAAFLAADVERAQRRETILLCLAPWAVCCALYFGSNVALAGTPLPATMKGRRWLWIESAGGEVGLVAQTKELLLAWAYRLRQFTLGVSWNGAVWIGLGLGAVGVHEAARLRRWALLALAAFVVIHVGIYVVVLPTPGHGGRYQPLVPVLFVLFAALGTLTLARLVARAGRVLVPAVAVGLLVLLGNAWWEWRLANAAATAHVNLVERRAGEALRELPADARIASFDVGAIGYFSERPLLDLGALTTPSVLPALVAEHVADLLVREHVTHLVLPAGVDVDQPDLSNFGFRLRVVDHPGLRLDPLATFESDRATWLRGVWYTQNATFRQRLYGVTKGVCPTVRPPVTPGPWSVGDAPAGDRARLERAYATAASAGLCVRAGREPPAKDCWSVALTDRPQLVSVPEGLADAARARTDAEIALRLVVSPHLARGDAAAASVAVLHALSAVVRADVDPCFFAPLPALERALPPGVMPPREPKDSVLWGLPLTVAVAAVGIVLARRRAA